MNDTIQGLTRLVKRQRGESVLGGLTQLVTKAAADAVPLEQLRGDIARAGYNISRLVAIDPEAKRLFFVDKEENPLYAEYGTEGGFGLVKVGFQREIAKEYDPVDLEPDEGSHVTTGHEESDQDYGEPGMIPGPTPGDKPVDATEDWDGVGVRSSGFSDEERPEDREAVEKMYRSLGKMVSEYAR